MGWADRTMGSVRCYGPLMLEPWEMERSQQYCYRKKQNISSWKGLSWKSGKMTPTHPLQGFPDRNMKSVNLGIDTDARVYTFLYPFFRTFFLSSIDWLIDWFFFHTIKFDHITSPFKFLPGPPCLPTQPNLCSFSVSLKQKFCNKNKQKSRRQKKNTKIKQNKKHTVNMESIYGGQTVRQVLKNMQTLKH